jgi:uncharacterized damage-inducible protein DinB
MIAMIEPMVKEMREEAGITRRVLERIPGDKLAWRPHARSMTLGQLGLHIANVPGGLTRIIALEEFSPDLANFNPPDAKSKEEICAVFEQSVRDAENFLCGMSEETASGSWCLKVGGKEALRRPRVEVVRAIMMNHLYHHRGQLSVYLRLLEVPVPVIYGRSADENPFA